jgi:16S rRNA (adenine1518-N6/adenine1519-N6)-dimethyltransferase
MPRKLGQHFLNNPEIIEKIIKSSNLDNNDVILEVGPGEGVLTSVLSENAKKVIAIEIDYKLIAPLKQRFKNKENIKIVHSDILKINLPELLEDNDITNYKLIANIPYYITSKILRIFLESEYSPKEIVLMVQKEVAERIVSKPGKMSKLSVSIQYYGEAEYLFTVTKDNFNPPPEVDSAVIRIKTKERKNKQTTEDDKEFFKIVRAGFCARRKTLINNLSNSLHLDKKIVAEKLKTVGILPTARAQELSIEKWKEISTLF